MPHVNTPLTNCRAAPARVRTWPARKQMTMLLGVALAWLMLSVPRNLVHGFFDREEGTTYFRYARLVPPLTALLAPHQQYYGLFPSTMALVEARVLPLSWAAVFSVWIVLFVHLLTVYLAATCERFSRERSKLLAVAVTFFAPGMAVIMVGSTQTQFAFALQCLLVLISDPQRHRIARTFCTVMGGLDGVVSCVLTPFFVYRAWRTRSGVAWMQAGILCACTAVQASVLHHALPYATRGNMPHRTLSTFINILSNHVLVLPFLTRFAYHPVSLMWRAPAIVSFAFTLASLAAFAVLANVIWPAGALARALFFIGVFHACCGALGMEGQVRDVLGGGERYFYVGDAAIGLALVLRWQQARQPVTSRHCAASWLLGLLLLSGVIDGARFWPLNQSGAVWGDEVRAWRQDPVHVTLTANPWFWGTHRMYLTPQPLRMKLPFYIFDSNTQRDVLDRFPRRLFGPDPAGMDPAIEKADSLVAFP